jgi:hypothetical protein
MPFLLLYVGEGRKFDQEAITNSLRALKGARPLNPCDDCLSTYDYKRGDDFTTIRFKKDQETIVIDGSGEASLYAALHIQAGYPEDIRLVDEGYNFDLVLHGVASLHQLERQIKDAGG